MRDDDIILKRNTGVKAVMRRMAQDLDRGFKSFAASNRRVALAVNDINIAGDKYIKAHADERKYYNQCLERVARDNEKEQLKLDNIKNKTDSISISK